ncbi:hypothetical protein FBEOM_12865 [Fusarium beomiforme]|uniref:Uncharacterized protein n=1 Tax=Fusarium beomiforme TaxID=44412 RepID=A0A9P5DPS9_9HYPO|nr:hypothetical protein FBEOM_12865 [Fusarium beomiforme]
MGPRPNLPASHAGIDRADPPSRDPKHSVFFTDRKHPNIKFDFEWMKALYRQSNFSFTGHYLTHNPTGPDNKWRIVFPTFLEQGWGFLFYYVGYSYRDKKDSVSWNRKWSVEQARAKGVENGKILKARAAALGHESQGAVVFVDNEDQQEKKPSNNMKGDLPLDEKILNYYDALFEECRIHGEGPNDGPAVRPGIYATENPAERIMARGGSADLFLWRCNPYGKDKHPQDLARIFDTRRPREVISPIELYPLESIVHSKDRTSMLLGRQWILYDNPGEGVPYKSIPPILTKIYGFDFNTSMVRDPRYPIAEPRIAVLRDIQIRSQFSRNDLSMHLEQILKGLPSLSLPVTAPDELLEPEAPLLLVDESNPELFTLNKTGQLVVISTTHPEDPRAPLEWSHPVSVIKKGSELVLRRNRAIAIAKSSPGGILDTQLFFVAQNHTLIGIHRLEATGWTEPSVIAEGQVLHPFSNIAAVTRGSESVDIFYLDKTGCIWTSSLPFSTTSWPGTNHQPLQSEPSLLQGTSLAAVSPSDDSLLVFGIGKDLLLHMASFTTAKGWSSVAAVPGLKEGDSKLFAHASMDVFAESPSTVYLATITEINVPCLYVLNLVNGQWKLKDPTQRRYYENISWNKVPGDTTQQRYYSPRAAAVGFSFNPFGDIKLGVVDSGLAMWIPGVTNGVDGKGPTETAMLMRKVLVELKYSFWVRAG